MNLVGADCVYCGSVQFRFRFLLTTTSTSHIEHANATSSEFESNFFMFYSFIISFGRRMSLANVVVNISTLCHSDIALSSSHNFLTFLYIVICRLSSNRCVSYNLTKWHMAFLSQSHCAGTNRSNNLMEIEFLCHIY